MRVENPQQKPIIEKKEKEKSGVRTLSDAVMKKCRIVLRCVANADEDRIFFNLLAKTNLKPNDPDDTGVLGYPAMVSRPLDFRTIDLRLAAGFYVTSHESFIEDVREVLYIIYYILHFWILKKTKKKKKRLIQRSYPLICYGVFLFFFLSGLAKFTNSLSGLS